MDSLLIATQAPQRIVWSVTRRMSPERECLQELAQSLVVTHIDTQLHLVLPFLLVSEEVGHLSPSAPVHDRLTLAFYYHNRTDTIGWRWAQASGCSVELHLDAELQGDPQAPDEPLVVHGGTVVLDLRRSGDAAATLDRFRPLLPRLLRLTSSSVPQAGYVCSVPSGGHDGPDEVPMFLQQPNHLPPSPNRAIPCPRVLRLLVGSQTQRAALRAPDHWQLEVWNPAEDCSPCSHWSRVIRCLPPPPPR